MQPRPTAFPLDGLFDEVSRTFRMVAQKAELRLVVRKTDAWVRTDRTMLARILNNLVSNALRYTQDGGVLVGARIARDGVRVDVWDTGSGIETADQARVFEEFFQAHATVGRGERGLGLGLATVQRLARLLGTEVSLRSRAGRGTVVSLVVPLANPVLQRDAPAVVDTPIDVSGLRVLVIDDSRIDRRLVDVDPNVERRDLTVLYRGVVDVTSLPVLSVDDLFPPDGMSADEAKATLGVGSGT